MTPQAFILSLDSSLDDRFRVADHICPELFEMIKLNAALLRELKESVGALNPYPIDPNLNDCLIRVERYLKGIPNAPRPI